MIHGYHLIMPTYGFWLPNDPRGSWSETVRKWELLTYGKSTMSCDRRKLEQLSENELQRREAARGSLRYPAVSLSADQIDIVAAGFAEQVQKSNYTIWACAILPEHTHLIVARHQYACEQITNLLKGAATRILIAASSHPLAEYTTPSGKLPHLWAEHQWIVFLDDEPSIENAISYVQRNPMKEGMANQDWEFVTPFGGISRSCWTTYHS